MMKTVVGEVGLRLRAVRTQLHTRCQQFWQISPQEWAVLGLAVILLCLGSPNRLLHWYPGALTGIAVLWGVCWRLPLRPQMGRVFGVWFVMNTFTFLPDLGSVEVLQPWEIVGGILVAPLIPMFYTTATLVSLGLTRALPLGWQPLGMAAVWTAIDGLMGVLRFPIPFHWGSLLFDWPLAIQIADLASIWGVTFFAVLVNGLLVVAVRELRPHTWIKGILPGIAVITFVLVYGAIQLSRYDGLVAAQRQDPARTFRVGAVQQVAWLESERSWPYRAARYQELFELSAQGVAQGAELILWPEGVLRAQLVGTSLEPYILDPMGQILPEQGALLLGTTEPDPSTQDLSEDQRQFINSALLYDAEGSLLDRFGKQWIFPYFESHRYRPSADGYRPLRLDPFGKLGVNICLESVLPGPSRELVRAGATSLITISDDSWFGNSNWPMLHGQLSVFRAVENRRTAVFVNNTGGNLIIDPSGRIQQRGTIFEKTVVVGSVLPRGEITLATRWGDWWAWICIATPAGLGIHRWRNGSRRYDLSGQFDSH